MNMKYILQSDLKSKVYTSALFMIIIGLCPFSVDGQDFSGLYNRLNPSVVTILTAETVFSNGTVSEGNGLGTGVLISERLIMTAAHVVGSAGVITVKFHDDQIIEAEVISSVSSADVALIQLEDAPIGIPIAELGDSDSANIGEQVLII